MGHRQEILRIEGIPFVSGINDLYIIASRNTINQTK